jgi:hypothetical protein
MKILFIISTVLLISTSVLSQNKDSVRYLGKGDKLISLDRFSFVNRDDGLKNIKLKGSYQKFLTDKISIGFNLSNESYLGSGYNYHSSSLISNYWFRKSKNRFRPYAGLGIKSTLANEGNLSNIEGFSLSMYMKTGFIYSISEKINIGLSFDINRFNYSTLYHPNNKFNIDIKPEINLGFKF